MARYKCTDGEIRSNVRAECLIEERILKAFRKAAKEQGISFAEFMNDVLNVGIQVEITRIYDAE
jgi:hypothetical protein